MENPISEKLSVSIPLTSQERQEFDRYCFVKGVKRGGFLRKVILEAIKETKQEAENEK